MITLLQKYWLHIVLVLSILGIIFYFITCNPVPTNETVYIHDTTIQTRYAIETEKDTVVKWYERITIKEVKADTVRYQKVDSVFIAEQDSKDLMLGIEKKGTDLRVFALNKKKQLLKEELFTGVYNNFTAYSAEDKIVIKTNVWYWNGVNFAYEQKRNVRDIKTIENTIDLTSGVNFKEKIYLDAGAEYDIKNREIRLKAKLNMRLL